MNSNIFKKTGIILAAVFFLLQFIQPSRNEGSAKSENDISNYITVPSTVQKTLETSCYDCHSNHTEYPWYSRIQPIGWWLKNHIDEGKEELNFSEFNAYSMKRKMKKMKEIAEMIEEDEMPLASYTFIHRNSVLSEAQKAELISWAKENQSKIITDSIAVTESNAPGEMQEKEEGHEHHESHDEHE